MVMCLILSNSKEYYVGKHQDSYDATPSWMHIKEEYILSKVTNKRKWISHYKEICIEDRQSLMAQIIN